MKITNRIADRNKVIEELQGLSGSKETMTLIADAVALLSEQPEIVRCKDCKYATMTIDGDLCKYCELDEDENGFLREVYRDADWFCADGEAKQDD